MLEAKRSIVLGIATLALLATVLALAGCASLSGEEGSASSTETATESGVETSTEALDGILEAVSAQNVEQIKSLMDAIWFFPGDYGISYDCFTREYFEGFEYSLGNSTLVDENTARVDITVSVRPQDEMLSSLQNAREAAVNAGADTTKDGYADRYLESSLDENPWETRNVSMSVQLVKNDEDEWMVKDEMTLASVMLDGVNPLQDAS